MRLSVKNPDSVPLRFLARLTVWEADAHRRLALSRAAMPNRRRRQCEGDDRVTKPGAHPVVATGSDDDELSPACEIGHRRRLAAGRQGSLPQLLAGRGIETERSYRCDTPSAGSVAGNPSRLSTVLTTDGVRRLFAACARRSARAAAMAAFRAAAWAGVVVGIASAVIIALWLDEAPRPCHANTKNQWLMLDQPACSVIFFDTVALVGCNWW